MELVAQRSGICLARLRLCDRGSELLGHLRRTRRRPTCHAPRAWRALLLALVGRQGGQQRIALGRDTRERLEHEAIPPLHRSAAAAAPVTFSFSLLGKEYAVERMPSAIL